MMRRPLLVLAALAALGSAVAVVGSAATLDVRSASIDTFDSATPASTTLPEPDGPGFFVATDGTGANNFLHRYDGTWSFLDRISLGSNDGRTPRGVAVTTEFVYVLDDDVNVVHRYAQDGTGRTLSAALSFTAGRGLAVTDDEVWVADQQASTVVLRRFSLAAIFGSGPLASSDVSVSATGATGLAVDGSDLYLLTADRILRLARTGGAPAASLALRSTSGGALAGSTRGIDVRDGSAWVLASSGSGNGTAYRFPLASLFAPGTTVAAAEAVSINSLDGVPEGL